MNSARRKLEKDLGIFGGDLIHFQRNTDAHDL